MTECKTEWDRFWRTRREFLSHEQPDSWRDLVWKIGLDYWHELFERLSPGRKMLECGSGSAKASLFMSKWGYSCVMLDNSYEGLLLGKTNFEQANITGKFVLGNIESLPFQDGTFDIVYSGGVLNHFYNIRPAISEMARVLKPGGLFGATVITRRFSCQSIGNIQIFCAKFIMNLLKRNFKGAVKESKQDSPFYVNSIPLKEYKRVVEENGLEDVVATGTSPFPAIALPKRLQPFYGKFMLGLLPLWRRFDGSNSKFTEVWGATFSIYGVKKKDR